MSKTFDELVREISTERGLFPDDVRFILTRAYRALEAVTPEMALNWVDATPVRPFTRQTDADGIPEGIDEHMERVSSKVWLAMLRASPLVPSPPK